MKRKLLSTILAGIMTLSCMIPAGSEARTFANVSEDDWFYSAVDSVVSKALFQGVSDTRFAPKEAMTRAMFVQVLANFTYNYTPPADDDIPYFRDVRRGAWYYDAVQWAAENNIAAGKGEALFDPHGQISRQEMVTMLFNYALQTGEATPFQANPLAAYDDQASIANWAEPGFRWAVSNGMIVGTGNNRLSPLHTAARVEVAAMFDNAYGRLESRRTMPVSMLHPSDPDQDYFDIVKTPTTLDDLSGGEAMAPDDVSALNGYTGYSGFEDFPGVTVYLSENTSGRIDYISVPVEALFPDLIGKTAGEAFGSLGKTASFIWDPLQSDIGLAPSLQYDTESCRMHLALDANTMLLRAGAPVFISYSPGQRRVEIPDDLAVTMTAKGATICTVTLPENGRSYAAFRHEIDLWSSLYFYEPVSALRYDEMNRVTLFSIHLMLESHLTDAQKGLASIKYLELNGARYGLIVNQAASTANHFDPDVNESFDRLLPEIANIHIEYHPDLNWLD